MAESKANRVKASKLRTRVAANKAKPGDREWLAAYDTRTAISKAKHSVGSATPTAPPRAVRGPQEALPMQEGVPSGATSQTVSVEGAAADPSSATWTPVAPEVPTDAPQTPGAPEAPAAGTPLVGDTAPQGGPKTAVVIAALFDYILTAGLKAADELLAGVELPEMIRAAKENPTARAKLHEEVQAAAMRVSVKRGLNFADGEATDEGLLLGVAVASGAAVYANRKKQQLGAAPAASRDQPPAQLDEQAQRESELGELFREMDT